MTEPDPPCQRWGCQPPPGHRSGIWCPQCGKSFDPEKTRAVLSSVGFKNFTGVDSTSPKVEEFWQTGDPSVFAKPGALDHQG